MKKICVVCFVLFFITINPTILNAQKTISFFAKDGILITADLYLNNDTLPYMILCHQSGSSRGEYLETAARFAKFGYNCIAIDMRSGEEINKIRNETAYNAKSKGRSTQFIDAEQDIRAAIDYAFDLNQQKVILVGSSYSASLVMKAAKNNSSVKAVIAFSPGEYFGNGYSLKDTIADLTKPLFVTSSKMEAPQVSELIKGVKSQQKQQFTPSQKGAEGSIALWKTTANRQEYWMALMMFMLNIK
jgi:pimeloyl-ACP methyl ester carboxylesterase